MKNYKIVSKTMTSSDDEVSSFLEKDYEWVEGWQEGEGRGMSTYDVFTDGIRFLLRAEHFGFDDTYYRFYLIEY